MHNPGSMCFASFAETLDLVTDFDLVNEIWSTGPSSKILQYPYQYIKLELVVMVRSPP